MACSTQQAGCRPPNHALPAFFSPAPQALSQTMFFFDTQREGYLPLSNPVSWRGSAFVADYNSSATLAAATPNATFDSGFGSFGSVGCWGLLHSEPGAGRAPVSVGVLGRSAAHVPACLPPCAHPRWGAGVWQRPVWRHAGGPHPRPPPVPERRPLCRHCRQRRRRRRLQLGRSLCHRRRQQRPVCHRRRQRPLCHSWQRRRSVRPLCRQQLQCWRPAGRGGGGRG